MGKTKTVVLEGKADKTEKKKDKIEKVGLKGGERIKTVEAGPIVKEQVLEETQAKRQKKIKVRGKKYQAAKAKVDPTKTYPLAEALKLVKETSYSSFDGTVELHLTAKKEGLTTTLTLPHASGATKKIEFATDETIKKLKAGKVDFDVLLATPETMPKLVPFARLLGPKGLMPNPKNGTLVKSEAEAKKFSGNQMTLKTEKKAPLIHTQVGKVSQEIKELTENVQAVLEAFGPRQIVKAYLKATMGPAVKLLLGTV